MAPVAQEICTPNERNLIVRKLTGDGPAINAKRLFNNREVAIEAIAHYAHSKSLKIAGLRQNGPSELADQSEERIQRELGKYGSRALRVGDAKLVSLRQLVADNNPQYQLALEKYLKSALDIGNATSETISIAMENGQYGFANIKAPTASHVIESLRNDRSGTSANQLILNCGGTNEEWGEARVGSGTTHIKGMHKRPIEKGKICDSWDAFWDLHFPEEVLASLQRYDPTTTTISVGLAFPIDSFKSPKTGRTDGRVVHFASKYEGAIGRTDATAGDPDPSLASVPFAASLQNYLQKKTGKVFQKITIVPNDTVAGKVAFATVTGERYEFLVDGTGANMSGTDSDGDTINTEMGHTNLFKSSAADRLALAMNGRTNFDTEVLISGGVLPQTFALLVRNIGGEALFERLPKEQGELAKLLFNLAYHRDPEILQRCSTTEQNVLSIIARKLLDRTEESLARPLAASKRSGTKMVYGEGSMLEPDFVQAVNGRVRAHDMLAAENYLQRKCPEVTFERQQDQRQYGEKLSASFPGNGQYARGDDLLTGQS